MLFQRLKNRQKWIWKSASKEEQIQKLQNPARGWYQIHSFPVTQNIDFKELEWCLNAEDTLAFVMIDIGDCRGKDLDEIALKRMEDILQFFVEHAYDILLRVVYDREGKAMEREPYFFGQVVHHMEQLKPLFEKFGEHIFVYQGMLVGNWGEMHTSRFLSENKLSKLTEILRGYRGEEMYLAVRRPVYWRMLHSCMSAEKPVCEDGMGLFDDGMFALDTHLGTFGLLPRKGSGWTDAWCREDELDFEEKLCRMVPNGGEAVYEENYANTLTQERVLADLRRMHITYLNRVYDARLLDIWKGWQYNAAGVWAGASVYDYIGAHLGYRLLIKKVSFHLKNGSETQGMLEIAVENTGFAALYQETVFTVESVDCQGARRYYSPEGGWKVWNSGECRTLTCILKLCECRIYFTAERKRDGRRIFFANRSDEEGRVLLGELQKGRCRR